MNNFTHISWQDEEEDEDEDEDDDVNLVNTSYGNIPLSQDSGKNMINRYVLKNECL